MLIEDNMRFGRETIEMVCKPIDTDKVLQQIKGRPRKIMDEKVRTKI